MAGAQSCSANIPRQFSFANTLCEKATMNTETYAPHIQICQVMASDKEAFERHCQRLERGI
jgi:hypothetical protein